MRVILWQLSFGLALGPMQAAAFGLPMADRTVAQVHAQQLSQSDSVAIQAGTRKITEAQDRPSAEDNQITADRAATKAIRLELAGNTDAAIDVAVQGLKFADRVLGRDDPVTNELVDTLAQLLVEKGQYAQAEKLFDRVFAWKRKKVGDQDPETLASGRALATVYLQQAKFLKAASLTEWLGRQAARSGPHSLVALEFVRELASIYSNSGRYEDAERLLKNILNDGEAPDDIKFPAQSNLGTLYQQEGRFGEAEQILLTVTERKEKSFGPDSLETAFALNNLANVYAGEQRNNEAARILERAIAITSSKLGENANLRLTMSGNLAMLYLNIGRIEDAHSLLRAIVHERETKLGPTDAATIFAKSNLADVWVRQGKLAEAEASYRQIWLRRQTILGKSHPQTLDSLANLARTVAMQGRFAEADQYYATLIKSNATVMGKHHPSTIARLAASVQNQLKLDPVRPTAVTQARLLMSALRGRPALAAPSVAADIERAQRLRAESASFLALPDAVWALSLQRPGRKPILEPDVFAALQEAMSGTTNAAIAGASARRIAARLSAHLAELVRSRQDLADQWTANQSLYQNALGEAGEHSPMLRAKLSAERQQIEDNIAHLERELRAQFPAYFSLIQPEPVDIAAAQRLLRPDEAILLVMPSDLGTHVVAVTSGEVEWRRSDWTASQVTAAVRRLLWDVGASVPVDSATALEWERQAGTGYSFDRNTAYRLYEQIVAPVALSLEGKRHVFVAVGGALTSLPLGLLVTEPPEGSNADPKALRSTKWFADAHALSVIPSIQALQFLRQTALRDTGTTGASDFAGYGDPTLGGASLTRGARSREPVGMRSRREPESFRSTGMVTTVDRIRELAQLPGTKLELEAMRTALNAPASSIHVRDQDTETNFKHADLSKVRILALATHGVMAGELGGSAEPGLIFTPPQRASEEDDGFLTASEVAQLQLNADWVILSACNTAAGDGSQGALGLSGLARAFFFAGADSLLVSHWPVRDDVASLLTVETIKLQRSDPRLSRSEALQRAMQHIRDDASHDTPDDTWAHPNAWAPFSLIGDGAE